MNKQKRGISLIVLVITIIIMVVLAGAAIIVLTNNNVINKAKLASTVSDKAIEKEAVTLAVSDAIIKANGENIDYTYLETKLPSTVKASNGTYVGYQTYTISNKGVITVEGGGETPIPTDTDKNKSYVGYYVDFDTNDNKIDGIIFADLVTGAVGDGQWGNNGSYTISQIAT